MGVLCWFSNLEYFNLVLPPHLKFLNYVSILHFPDHWETLKCLSLARILKSMFF